MYSTSRGAKFALLVLIACVPASAEIQISISECQVSGISLRESRSVVLERLGKPDESGAKCNDCIDIMDSWYIYEGLEIKFLNFDVIEIGVTSSTHKLKSGLGVNNTKNEIVGYYGEPLVIADEYFQTLRYLVVWSDGKRSSYKLDFKIVNGVVNEYDIHVGE